MITLTKAALFLMLTSAAPARADSDTRVIDFAQGLAGFRAGFADYPAGSEDFYELRAGLAPLPTPLVGSGYYLSGNNHSDDLLMFIEGPVHGLVPGTTYQVVINAEFATNVPQGCMGTGGSPGESVFVKVAAVPQEPQVAVVNGYRRLAIDVGQQNHSGKDGVVVGNFANADVDCDRNVWQLKTLGNASTPLQVKSQDGSLWLLVGFDSGFEATTSTYVTRLRVTLMPIAAD